MALGDLDDRVIERVAQPFADLMHRKASIVPPRLAQLVLGSAAALLAAVEGISLTMPNYFAGPNLLYLVFIFLLVVEAVHLNPRARQAECGRWDNMRPVAALLGSGFRFMASLYATMAFLILLMALIAPKVPAVVVAQHIVVFLATTFWLVGAYLAACRTPPPATSNRLPSNASKQTG